MRISSPKLKSNNGFTLIELLIVLIIVSILAVLAVTQYANMVEKSRVTAAKSVLWEIRVAFGQKVLNSRVRPTKLIDLDLHTDLAPRSCNSDTYYKYSLRITTAAEKEYGVATRCTTSGSKYPPGKKAYEITLDLNNSTWSGTKGFK